MPNQTLRVFCAIELPSQVRHLAAGHIAALRKAVPTAQAKWDQPEKLHITLKFLGELSLAQVEALKTATETTATQGQPFELRIEQTGFFPSRGQARVLWLGITDVSRKLGSLQEMLERECFQAGFARETRAFHPHLTIARLKGAATDRPLAETHQHMPFAPVSFQVGEIVVMRSELLPSGSRYTPIGRYKLKQ